MEYIGSSICIAIVGIITFRMSLFLKAFEPDTFDLYNAAGPSYYTIKTFFGLFSLAESAFFITAFFYMNSWWQPIVVCLILPSILSSFLPQNANTNANISQLGCFIAPILTIMAFGLLLF